MPWTVWGAIISTGVVVAGLAFVGYEAYRAPELDNDGYVIEDKHGTLGPKFKKGDPIPPVHHGKRYD